MELKHQNRPPEVSGCRFSPEYMSNWMLFCDTAIKKIEDGSFETEKAQNPMKSHRTLQNLYCNFQFKLLLILEDELEEIKRIESLYNNKNFKMAVLCMKLLEPLSDWIMKLYSKLVIIQKYFVKTAEEMGDPRDKLKGHMKMSSYLNATLEEERRKWRTVYRNLNPRKCKEVNEQFLEATERNKKICITAWDYVIDESFRVQDLEVPYKESLVVSVKYHTSSEITEKEEQVQELKPMSHKIAHVISVENEFIDDDYWDYSKHSENMMDEEQILDSPTMLREFINQQITDDPQMQYDYSYLRLTKCTNSETIQSTPGVNYANRRKRDPGKPSQPYNMESTENGTTTSVSKFPNVIIVIPSMVNIPWIGRRRSFDRGKLCPTRPSNLQTAHTLPWGR